MIRFLLILLLFNFSLFVLCSAQNNQAIPMVEKGEIDLRNWDFEKDGIIDLNGEWLFYYRKFLASKEFDTLTNKNFIKIPGTWLNHTWENDTLGGHGFATFKVKILLPKNCPSLSVKISEINTAYTLIVNNQKIAQQGQIGETEETSIPSFLPQIIYIGKGDTLDVVFQVSNFQHIQGGLWSPVKLGITHKVHFLREQNLLISALLSGLMFLMIFSHLGIYISKRSEKSSLYFSFVCLLALVRNNVMDEAAAFLVVSSLSDYYELVKQIEFCAFFLMVPAFYTFIHSLYPEDFSKPFLRFTQIVGISFTVANLFTTTAVNSSFILYYQFFLLTGLVYIFYVTFLIIRRQRPDSGIFILCILFIVLAGINDVLYFNKVFSNFQLLPYAIFVFLYLQSYIISKRTIISFKNAEKLSDELKKLNATLESQVEKRTAELNENLRLVSTQKEEIETQHDKAMQLNNEINLQKINIEEKNKKLADWQFNLQASIQYAQRIQNAILPVEEEINSYFKGFFILFKPRDVVSGDFYYFNTAQDKVIIAAIDCTGHGVPGAFMSLIGNEILNNIIERQKITEPDIILNELHKGIRKVLKQDQSDNRDGMDAALLVIDEKNKKASYAGAKNPLIYIQGGKLSEIKADKMPIGGEQKEQERFFTKHTVSISDPTVFYLFTDGYQDQFGGEKRKKFMLNQMRILFSEIFEKPMNIQKDILEQNFGNWMNQAQERQIDDVLVMGIKI